VPFKYDQCRIPGDMNYAPFEQKYSFHFSNDFQEKYAADLYLFGSLFFYYFCDISLNQLFQSKLLSKKISLSQDFETDLPILNLLYSEIISEFEEFLKKMEKDPEIVTPIVDIVKSLTNPDPRKRGHLKNIGGQINQYCLERIITQIDVLARKAEYKIK
jgi:hypothetical protein